jgi:hypothetical protein
MDSTGIKIKSPAEIETKLKDRHREILRRIQGQADAGKSTLYLEGQLFELTFTAVHVFGITLNE